MPFSGVKPDVKIPAQEEGILDYWKAHQIFEKSMNQKSQNGPKSYSFYDGPPFATGLPHYGHILAGVLKDIVPRFWTMKGYNVPRRFGWDCHGLPVEYEINKAHKIESRKDVLKMGVKNYNQACRSIVKRYSEEWKKTVSRVGRWVDMDHPYFTMDASFMESVWWVFSELYKKGLIYEGYKVMPYSTGISTPLSNMEANLNYKVVQDPAITVAFPTVEGSGHADAAFLAWTTTPWTLPSNLGLAVGRDLEYVKVLHKKDGKRYILARARLEAVFAKDDLEILQEYRGSDLIGTKYVPLFDYFKDRASAESGQGAFRIIHSDHVTLDSGTGIVHMAPAFGEEDYFACQKEGIAPVNPVDDDGVFTSAVPEYQNRKVKDADKDIIADLKKMGRLVKQETIDHSYPFCYRSDTPLIYRAVSSWFVAVEKIKDRLVKNNQQTTWVPEHLKEGRFGNWLENARDWSVSRNRFWGTPLPLWRNPEGEVICIGSIAQLEALSGTQVGDLHIDTVDEILIPSPTGKSPLKRVDGVLDCWFESGSMPYAQWGYPKTNVEEFKKAFPADFIAEGLDQTRGWFYTLSVIGTALFDQAPFKNVVVNGLVLAEDGRKMSKSLKNYPDPSEVLNAHGADALRLYLIDSPVVKAQELKFAESGVRDIARKILLRWWNSYSFFVNYANVDRFVPKRDFKNSPNVLDQWVLSRLHSLIQNTQREMSAYRLYNVVPHLLQFIEDLTNTYIRFNRSHFWREGMPEDKRYAFETLYEVLLSLSKLMAPFAPFMSEVTYLNLIQTQADKKESVHLESYPEAHAEWIRPELEKAVQVMETLVTLGRNQREKLGVKGKIPLRELKVIHRDEELLRTLQVFESYIKEELNVNRMVYDSNEDAYIQISAKPNFPVLGKRLGPKMKQVGAGVQKLGLASLLELEQGKQVIVEGEALSLAEVEIRRQVKGQNPNLCTHQLVSIELDPTVTPEQEQEGLAREVMRKIQMARKAADFNLDDRIQLEIGCSGAMKTAVEVHQSLIQKETLAVGLKLTDLPQGKFTSEYDIDGDCLKLGLTVVS